MCGAAGRSSEINKPKGEGWWSWDEEVEERVAGGRRRLEGTAGPTTQDLPAGFLGAVAFCFAQPTLAAGQRVDGEGRAGGESGKLSRFPDGGEGSGTKGGQGRWREPGGDTWERSPSRAWSRQEPGEGRGQDGPLKPMVGFLSGEGDPWGGAAAGQRSGCRGGHAPGEAEKQRELPAGTWKVHICEESSR